MHIYFKNIIANFYPDPIWDFFEDGPPQQEPQ